MKIKKSLFDCIWLFALQLVLGMQSWWKISVPLKAFAAAVYLESDHAGDVWCVCLQWFENKKLTWQFTLQIDPGSRRRWRWRSSSRRSSLPSSTSCRRTTERTVFSRRCVCCCFLKSLNHQKKNLTFSLRIFGYYICCMEFGIFDVMAFSRLMQ